MKKIIMMSLFVLINFTFVSASEFKQVSDVDKGRVLAESCSACHGVAGKSTNPEWPNLAAQNKAYLVKQLTDYRTDERKDSVMSAMAKSIKSNDDVDYISAYFSSLPASLGKVENDDLVLLGESIYRGGIVESGVAACSACHGPTGTGNPMAKFPRVAGQHSKYIVTQLESFKSGERDNDDGKMMRNIAEKMTTKQMEAVAEYMFGLSE